MTKVISFLNRKGGTGKTTTAVNVTKVLTSKGFRVTLIETDRNTPTSIIEMTETYTAPEELKIVHATELNAARIIKQMKGTRDFLIVDGAAEMSKETLCGIAKLSDLVLIPTNTNEIEINASRMTLADLAGTQKLKVAILPTRIHWSTNPGTVLDSLACLHTPVLPAIISWKELTYLNIQHPAERIFRTFTNRLLKILNDTTGSYDFSADNRNTVSHVREARHYLKCGYRKCDINDGYYYSTSAKSRFCCPTHKTLEWRMVEMEKKEQAAHASVKEV